DLAGVGAEVVGGVLGGDAALHGVAADRDVLLVDAEVGEGLAARDAQLALHQVDAGDLLGHGVLDLDARVHLDEDVLAPAVDEELHGARVLVADLTGELHRVLAEPLRHRRVELRRGRDLHDLLVAALHRAVPLPQVDDVPGAVREDLHLDVAGIVHRLLQEHRRVAERALGLAARRVHGGLQLFAAVHAAQPAPAAAGRGLHEQREPCGVGCLRLPAGLGPGPAQHRQARTASRLDGLDLVALEPQHGRRRAAELDPVAFARLRQLGALREESVAGVDGVGPDAQRG